MIRSTGILMPVTSLPSKYGVGTLGQEAKKFIDFLAEAGETYWEILPLGPTGYGNSPYQPLSSYAGNPYLVDLEELIEEGLLTKKEVEMVTWSKTDDRVDYGILYNEREKVLKLATDRLSSKTPEDYLQFLQQEQYWLKDYATFMAIKKDQKGAAWQSWPEEYRRHDSEAVKQKAEELSDTVIFYERVQYLFYKQATAIKTYAQEKGIQIIGDLPFYMGADSIDVWSHPEQFSIDDNGNTYEVSGTPDGQKWGNPLFKWEAMRNEGYHWWIERTKYQFRYCDVLRIDHFKGYESFYAIPSDREGENAGEWRQGPGLDLFRKMEEQIGKKELILEDLGYLTEDFKQMVKDSGYPGMRILQYAFDPKDPGSWYMPFQYIENSVVYIGTHDNNTLLGWLNDKNEKLRVDRCREYLGVHDKKDLSEAILKAAYGTVSKLVIFQIQDFLCLGKEARINDPSGADNWTWRMDKNAISSKLVKQLKEWNLLYCRNNWNTK